MVLPAGITLRRPSTELERSIVGASQLGTALMFLLSSTLSLSLILCSGPKEARSHHLADGLGIAAESGLENSMRLWPGSIQIEAFAVGCDLCPAPSLRARSHRVHSN